MNLGPIDNRPQLNKLPHNAVGHRLRWPLTSIFTFLLFEPRGVPEGRGSIAGASARALRFSSLRSALSVTCLVFIRA